MLFIDSSDYTEIHEIFSWGVVSGVTTNPLILARESEGNHSLEARINRILDESQGPVSVQVTGTTKSEMLQQAGLYQSWDEQRIVVKVPFSEVGLQVTKLLQEEDIPVNVTCIMNFNQAYLAMCAGARFVSIFAGRIADMGYDPWPVISETKAVFDRECPGASPCGIIAASIRHPAEVTAALKAGADIVTVPPPILRKMLRNPRTESTIAEFNQAWAERGLDQTKP